MLADRNTPSHSLAALGRAKWLQFLALTGPLHILAGPLPLPSPPLTSIYRATKSMCPSCCCPKEADEFSGTLLTIVFLLWGVMVVPAFMLATLGRALPSIPYISFSKAKF